VRLATSTDEGRELSFGHATTGEIRDRHCADPIDLSSPPASFRTASP
jgi:hypothetical protein